ncbi:MAG: PHB depolymerase family esterase [Lacisediminihabitans sp.]
MRGKTDVTAVAGIEAVRRSFRFDGRERSMVVVSSDEARFRGQDRPIVLVFHGSNQTGEGVRRFAGRTFDALAAEGAIVAYPDGLRKRWNAREPSDSTRGGAIDDVGFALALVEYLASEFGGNPDRVYALGYSNGGHFVMRMAHEVPERLAGIASISASQLVAGVQHPVDSGLVGLPALFIHGTKDPMVPYRGGTSGWRARLPWGPALSARDSADYYAKRNGITAPSSSAVVESRFPSKRTSVERTDYRQPTSAPVTLYSIIGGGHTIPNPTETYRILGATGHDIVAAQVIAEFFGLGYRSTTDT